MNQDVVVEPNSEAVALGERLLDLRRQYRDLTIRGDNLAHKVAQHQEELRGLDKERSVLLSEMRALVDIPTDMLTWDYIR